MLGVAAVLLGSVISTLAGRLTTFGLADVEGAVHAGFDEGAWITTAFTVGQMMIALVSSWLGMVFGVRRVLMVSCAVFVVSNFLIPFSPNLRAVLALQAVSGLSSGTFIPLTIGVVVLNLPPRLAVYGVAAYAMNLELSLNVSASIEGWFDANWSWRWIFWDSALLAPVMWLCVYFGVPRQTFNRALFGNADWAGMLFASVGLSLVYAALDQGNRLDWFNSGLIVGLTFGGCVLIVAFLVHELTHDRPWINLRFAASGNLPLVALYISFFRLVILSTSYIIPQYLITVQGYRALEVGGALVWIAMPQFLLAPIIATILRFVDARVTMALGFAFIGIACAMAGQLTGLWATDQFMPSQILQAVGQTFALTSLIWFALRHLQPAEVLTFGALLQTGRLFGSEVGSSFVQTFVRVREQIHSNFVGQHIVAGAPATVARLQQYAHAVVSRSAGEPQETARAAALLAVAARRQSYVLAYIDGFMLLSVAVVAALLLMLTLKDPPATPVR
ncbi:MAG: MFS transporter [Roseiarcus sp.]|jgi:MFS transporter, DHA2 family, multidrug resistance protein